MENASMLTSDSLIQTSLKVRILYLIQFHVGQFAQSDSCIKKDHEDHFVSDADIIAPVEVFQHQGDLFRAEGMNQHLRLLYILDSLGQDLFTVTFLLGIGAEAFDGFEQIVDVCGLTSSVLQGTYVLLNVHGFQLFKLNHLKVFSNKMAEFIELFFIIVDCKF